MAYEMHAGGGGGRRREEEAAPNPVNTGNSGGYVPDSVRAAQEQAQRSNDYFESGQAQKYYEAQPSYVNNNNNEEEEEEQPNPVNNDDGGGGGQSYYDNILEQARQAAEAGKTEANRKVKELAQQYEQKQQEEDIPYTSPNDFGYTYTPYDTWSLAPTPEPQPESTPEPQTAPTPEPQTAVDSVQPTVDSTVVEPFVENQQQSAAPNTTTPNTPNVSRYVPTPTLPYPYRRNPFAVPTPENITPEPSYTNSVMYENNPLIAEPAPTTTSPVDNKRGDNSAFTRRAGATGEDEDEFYTGNPILFGGAAQPGANLSYYDPNTPVEDQYDAQAIRNARLETVLENTPPEYRGADVPSPRDFVAKGVQSLVNRWNADADADAWVGAHMPANVSWENVDAVRDNLYEQYYRELESGAIQPSNPLLGSNDVRDWMDAADENVRDWFGGLGEALAPSEEQQNQYNAYEAAGEAAAEAGLEVGSPEYYRYINEHEGDFASPTSTSGNDWLSNTIGDEAFMDITRNVINNAERNNIANEYLQNTSVGGYINELQSGDPRNVPPELMPQLYQIMTGDSEYVQELQNRYEYLKEAGLNDSQISNELYRMAANHQNPLAEATDREGNVHFNYVLGREGILPESESIPLVDGNGTGNLAFNDIVNSVIYTDDKGMGLYRDDDGTYWQPVENADGTIGRVRYAGNVNVYNRYTPEDVLALYVNPNGGHNGEPVWRGMDDMFNNLSEQERAGMMELLSNFVAGGDKDRLRDGFSREFTNLTPDEYERLADLFYKNMPALQELIRRGVISERFADNFFFKAPQGSGNGSGSGSGRGGYSRRSYGGGGGRGGGGRGGGGSRSSSGGWSNNNPLNDSATRRVATSSYPSYQNTPTRRTANSSGGYYNGNNYNNYTPAVQPTTANQRQNRVYNIMKNWSF